MAQVVNKMEDRSGDESKDTIEADLKIDMRRTISYAQISDDETEAVVGEHIGVENSEKIKQQKKVKSDPDLGKCCIQKLAEIAKLKEVNKRQKEDLFKSEMLYQLKEEQIKLQEGQIKLQEGRIKLLEQELKLEKPEKKNPVVYDLD